MAAKFHIALFCSEAAYAARKSFYTAVFGMAPVEGEINDGSVSRNYEGSRWDRGDGYLFVLLKNLALTGSEEELAHIGFMFDSSEEFDAEIRKRAIDTQTMKVYDDGQKQAFKKDKNGVEWEVSYDPPEHDG